MRILVTEYVCGGGWNEPRMPPSLAAEGQAMLRALLGRAAELSVEILATWDPRAGTPPDLPVRWILHDAPADYDARIRELAARCDQTLLIAPETGGILARLTGLLERDGRAHLGARTAGVAVAADKLRTAELLAANGVPVVPTQGWDVSSPEWPPVAWPAVVKPRDGAGSQHTWRVDDDSAWKRLQQMPDERAALRNAVVQPFVPGRPLSVGCLVDARGGIVTLPVCDQVLSADGRFAYGGGICPAPGVDPDPIQRAARRAVAALPGMRGYVGVDLLLPADTSSPIIVEVNPRPTTSLVGYAALAVEPILEWLLAAAGGRAVQPGFHAGRVSFTADGA